MTLCVGIVGALGVVDGAAAQDAPSFPASLDREPLLAWLRRETDITPDRVVAVTPQSLTAVVSIFPAVGGQGPRVVIRAEALAAETFARTGSLSWHVSLTADCAGRRLRLGETNGYAQRNLLGEQRLLRAADPDWRPPEPGTALEYAWRAACDPNFQGPFQSRAMRVAEGEASGAGAPGPASPAAAPPARPAPPPPAAQAGAARGAMVAQIGAAASESDARTLFAALGRGGAGRRTWIERADVGGRTWYRAVVGGFADAADAQAFCAGLRSAGRPCLVRKPR